MTSLHAGWRDRLFIFTGFPSNPDWRRTLWMENGLQSHPYAVSSNGRVHYHIISRVTNWQSERVKWRDSDEDLKAKQRDKKQNEKGMILFPPSLLERIPLEGMLGASARKEGRNEGRICMSIQRQRGENKYGMHRQIIHSVRHRWKEFYCVSLTRFSEVDIWLV